MAFEFHYSISLTIIHPSLDPVLFTEQISELQPRTEIKVGTELVDAGGLPNGRNARNSFWSAPLHKAKRLYSETNPISEFIGEKLAVLKRHRELFHEWKEDGYVVLQIDWFSETGHSAACLESDVIRRCADLGLGIELCFYASRGGS